ncbi:MAG: hypothetical protein KC620_03145, partial [Myxococcales bacterium]|nr:hypothetical protein [Myxococcales bacterium]
MLVPLAGLLGCSDAVAPQHRQVLVEVPEDRSLAPPVYDDRGNPTPPEEAPPSAIESGYILIVDGDDDKTVPLGGQVELRVLLFDTTGEPVEGMRVEYVLE